MVYIYATPVTVLSQWDNSSYIVARWHGAHLSVGLVCSNFGIYLSSRWGAGVEPYWHLEYRAIWLFLYFWVTVSIGATQVSPFSTATPIRHKPSALQCTILTMHGRGGGIVPGVGYTYLVWNDQCMGYCFCTYTNLRTYTIVKICTCMPEHSGTNSTSISIYYQNFTSTRLYMATFSCLQCTSKVRTSILFLHLSTSLGCFWTQTIFLNKKNGLDKLPLTSSISDLYTILR